MPRRAPLRDRGRACGADWRLRRPRVSSAWKHLVFSSRGEIARTGGEAAPARLGRFRRVDARETHPASQAHAPTANDATRPRSTRTGRYERGVRRVHRARTIHRASPRGHPARTFLVAPRSHPRGEISGNAPAAASACPARLFRPRASLSPLTLPCLPRSPRLTRASLALANRAPRLTSGACPKRSLSLFVSHADERRPARVQRGGRHGG
jgi:hypothetical protein